MDSGENSSEVANKKQKTDLDGFEGFISPNTRDDRYQARLNLKKREEQKKANNNNIILTNNFNILSDTEMSIDEVTNKPKRKRKSKTKPTTETANPQQKPLRKPIADNKSSKPIIIANTSYPAIQGLLTSLTLSTRPSIQKKRHGPDYTVIAHSIDDKKKIMEKLTSTNQQHFTFTEKEDRHLMFVLNGHFESTPDALLEELKRNKVPAVKVSQINKSKEDPLFLVSFEKNSITFNDLQYSLNVLDGLKVFWEHYNPKSRRPTQCKRCQRFGHAAVNCKLAFRCIKCKESHEPGNCTRISPEAEGEPSCVNCGLSGHPANSRSCTVFKKYIDRLQSLRNPAQHQPRSFPAARYNWHQHQQNTSSGYNGTTEDFPPIASQSSQPGTSNPTIVKNNSEYRPFLHNAQAQSQSQNSSSNFSQLRALQNELSSLPDMQETIKLFAQFVSDMKLAKTQEERIQVLFNNSSRSTPISQSQP